MTKREAENRTIFADIIASEVAATEYPLSDKSTARTLADLICRHGKTYSRLQEMNCNGVGTFYGESNESFAKRQDRHEKWVEKREQQIEKRIAAICAELGEGFAPIFQGDPRGNTIRIRVPSGRQNDGSNIGEGGISVPTS